MDLRQYFFFFMTALSEFLNANRKLIFKYPHQCFLEVSCVFQCGPELPVGSLLVLGTLGLEGYGQVLLVEDCGLPVVGQGLMTAPYVTQGPPSLQVMLLLLPLVPIGVVQDLHLKQIRSSATDHDSYAIVSSM